MTVEIITRYTEDLIISYKRYDTFNWWPREVTEIAYYDEDERILAPEPCPKCHRAFTIKAGLYVRLLQRYSEVLCYRCKVRMDNYHMAQTVRYISGQRNFLDDDMREETA